jgi:hypothetical protein
VNPGLAPLVEQNEEVANIDELQPMDMGEPLYEPPAGIDEVPQTQNLNTHEGMEGKKILE